MTNLRRPLLALLALGLPAACADPCLDDGLGQADQANCPSLLTLSGTDTESATDSNSNSNTISESADTTEGMSGSQSGTESETSSSTLWCVDADGDGFGDPDMCQQSDEPIPGSVDNDLDCDDSNPNTYPGAAENETPPDQCMKDDDGDGWGDDDPPPGVVPGTDCDDTNPDAYPGAAENEVPPGQCMVDADGDGWGDANPGGGGGGGGGPVPGSDCYDGNSQLNPGTLQLTAFLPYNAGAGEQRRISSVDVNDASLGDFLELRTPAGGNPNVNIVTATFNGEGEIFSIDLTAVRLYSIDYAMTCGEGFGEAAAAGVAYGPGGDIVCGLEFSDDGTLYGIGHTGDDLRTFDPRTGQVLDSIPITLGGNLLDVFSCGMARDCTETRFLLANGVDRIIYSLDETTGAATVLRDLSDFFPSTWTPTGLEYDPVTRTALLSTGDELYRVDLADDTVDPELIGTFASPVSNLQHLPICL